MYDSEVTRIVPLIANAAGGTAGWPLAPCLATIWVLSATVAAPTPNKASPTAR